MLIALLGVVLLAVSVPSESANGRQIVAFKDTGVSMNSVKQMDIYYTLSLDQNDRNVDMEVLRKRSAARLTIWCGARCDTVPRIVNPIMSAKKISSCPIHEIEFIVDFDNAFSVAVTRDRRSFLYDGVCFRSDTDLNILYGIFDYYF
jgi:hypothetical protein